MTTNIETNTDSNATPSNPSQGRRNALSRRTWFAASLFCLGGLACIVVPLYQTTANEPPQQAAKQNDDEKKESKTHKDAKKLETITLGAGCFWCVEAVYQRLDGVESVVSGYMGGQVANPTYKQVCTGTTGHAEVCQIKYDPEVVSFDEVLEVFWKTHDPTTLNQQGPDFGTQYRSAIFYSTDEQRETAEKYKKKLNEAGAFGRPVVTEIVAADTFYPAEDYHQNYFNRNSYQSYCRNIIAPKVDKFKKVFRDKVQKPVR